MSDSENEVCKGLNKGIGFLKKDDKDKGSVVGNEVQTDDIGVDHHRIDDIGEGITRADDAATDDAAVDDVVIDDAVADDVVVDDAVGDDVVIDNVVGDDVAVEDDENVYIVKVRYLSDGEGDEEL